MLPQPSGLSELSPQSAAKALECSQPSSVWPGLQDASIVTAGKVPFPSTPSPIWAWIKVVRMKFRGFSFGAAAAPSRAVTSFSFIGFASKFSVRSDKRGPFLGKWLVSTQVERKRRRQANWYSALPTPCLAGVSAQSFFMAFLRTCMGSKRSSSARCSPSSSICSASDRDSSQSSH
jgi:hypothetical protein